MLSEQLRNASALAENIKKQFPKKFKIEVFVLNTAGNGTSIFTGRSTDLKPDHFLDVLTEPGTLYLFSAAGIPNSYVDIADMVPGDGKKVAFCWITPPSSPVLSHRGSRELSLSWNPLAACGVVIDEDDGLLQYALEAFQGEQYHRGVPPTSLQPPPDADFKLIAKGPKLLSCHVEELDASYWYYWRVVFEYSGARFESAPAAINTSPGVPLTPKLPCVDVEKCPGPMLEKRTSVEYKVVISWPPADFVGASIEKYLLQLHEVSIGLNEKEIESMAPGVNSPKSKMFRQMHKIAIDEDVGSKFHEKDVVSSRWRTIYCDNKTTFSLRAPPLGTLQWNFRLRAKNSCGWSEEWMYFFMNARSHPDIFPAGKHLGTSRYTHTAPLSKEPPLQLQTQPYRSGTRGVTAQKVYPASAPADQSHDGHASLTDSETGFNADDSTFDSKTPFLASVSRRPEPSEHPPYGLLGASTSVDNFSIWTDERSLEIHSYSIESAPTAEETLNQLTNSEVTRVVNRHVGNSYHIDNNLAQHAIGAPFKGSYGGDPRSLSLDDQSEMKC